MDRFLGQATTSASFGRTASVEKKARSDGGTLGGSDIPTGVLTHSQKLKEVTTESPRDFGALCLYVGTRSQIPTLQKPSSHVGASWQMLILLMFRHDSQKSYGSP